VSEIGDKSPADLEVDTSWRAGKRVVRRDAQIETRVTGGGVFSEDSERSQQMPEGGRWKLRAWLRRR
jgi:hypothetical protein